MGEIPHRKATTVKRRARGRAARDIGPPHFVELAALNDNEMAIAVGATGIVAFAFKASSCGHGDGDRIAVGVVEVAGLSEGTRCDGGVGLENLDGEVDAEAARAPALRGEPADDSGRLAVESGSGNVLVERCRGRKKRGAHGRGAGRATARQDASARSRASARRGAAARLRASARRGAATCGNTTGRANAACHQDAAR